MIVELLIVRVHLNRRAGGGFELGGASDMVDMRVRDHDRLHGQRVLLQHGENLLDLVARIDHDGFARLLVAEDGAIALEHAYGQDFVNHVVNQGRGRGLIIQ